MSGQAQVATKPAQAATKPAKKISLYDIDFGPDVKALAARIARATGENEVLVMNGLRSVGATMSMPVLMEVAKGDFKDSELHVSAVRQRVRRIVNGAAPSFNYCTGGASSIEITPNGGYGRCPKFNSRDIYTGNLRDEGPFRVLDVEKDDMTCEIRCPKLMCFTKNVLREPNKKTFKAEVARQGIHGTYGKNWGYAQPDIFIRWKITDTCNYTCSYCTDWRTVNKKGMELTDAEMMVAANKMIAQFNNISLRLTGGEPSARRNYVELMRLVHTNLDRFTNVEIRTNLSFQEKHKEVLSWDWQGKLHLHIGCHIRDKSFMPWRMIPIVSIPTADYYLKFVSTPRIRDHVDYFRRFFLDNGIPANRILVIDEVLDKEVEEGEAPEEVPLARRMLESNGGKMPLPSARAKAMPAPVVQQNVLEDAVA